jgi:hypothetical protein
MLSARHRKRCDVHAQPDHLKILHLACLPVHYEHAVADWWHVVANIAGQGASTLVLARVAALEGGT